MVPELSTLAGLHAELGRLLAAGWDPATPVVACTGDAQAYYVRSVVEADGVEVLDGDEVGTLERCVQLDTTG